MATKRARRRRVSRKRKSTTPESLAAGQITDFLTAHAIRYKRNQVGVARYGSHFVKYGEKGEADYTAFVPAGDRKFYILNIECKAENGRQSYEQKLWQQLVEAMGEFYIVARSYEPVRDWLKEKGFLK